MTKFKFFRKFLSASVLSVLIAVTVLISCGCESGTNNDDNSSALSTVSDTESVQTVGEGALSFTLEVDTGTEKTTFSVKTDKTTVGEALSELGLISGEESEYGLYVKTVNGVTADYDVDGSYWAFYENGNMAAKGVDSTEAVNGAVYGFKIEK